MHKVVLWLIIRAEYNAMHQTQAASSNYTRIYVLLC